MTPPTAAPAMVAAIVRDISFTRPPCASEASSYVPQDFARGWAIGRGVQLRPYQTRPFSKRRWTSDELSRYVVAAAPAADRADLPASRISCFFILLYSVGR